MKNVKTEIRRVKMAVFSQFWPPARPNFVGWPPFFKSNALTLVRRAIWGWFLIGVCLLVGLAFVRLMS